MLKNDLQKRIDQLIKEHGGVRPAAAAVDIDPSYLLRLQHGARSGASDETLKKLGLRRIVTYVRIGG